MLFLPILPIASHQYLRPNDEGDEIVETLFDTGLIKIDFCLHKRRIFCLTLQNYCSKLPNSVSLRKKYKKMQKK